MEFLVHQATLVLLVCLDRLVSRALQETPADLVCLDHLVNPAHLVLRVSKVKLVLKVVLVLSANLVLSVHLEREVYLACLATSALQDFVDPEAPLVNEVWKANAEQKDLLDRMVCPAPLDRLVPLERQAHKELTASLGPPVSRAELATRDHKELLVGKDHLDPLAYLDLLDLRDPLDQLASVVSEVKWALKVWKDLVELAASLVPLAHKVTRETMAASAPRALRAIEVCSVCKVYQDPWDHLERRVFLDQLGHLDLQANQDRKDPRAGMEELDLKVSWDLPVNVVQVEKKEAMDHLVLLVLLDRLVLLANPWDTMPQLWPPSWDKDSPKDLILCKGTILPRCLQEFLAERFPKMSDAS